MAQEWSLPPKTLSEINTALENISKGEKFLAKAASGGINVGEKTKALQDTKNKLLRIKNAFYPGQ